MKTGDDEDEGQESGRGERGEVRKRETKRQRE